MASLLVHALFIAWVRPQGGRHEDEAPPLAATLRVPLMPPRMVDDSLSGRASGAKRLRPLSVPGARGPAGPSSVEENPVSVDIESARQIARAIPRSPASQRSRDTVTEPETPLARAIANSAREDCRSAYAGNGLFALPLLLKDAMISRGCRW